MARKGRNKAVTDYWLAHFVSGTGLCSLCGNHGFVDTRGVRSPAGVEAGRIDYCICPNGQILRGAGVEVPKDMPPRAVPHNF